MADQQPPEAPHTAPPDEPHTPPDEAHAAPDAAPGGSAPGGSIADGEFEIGDTVIDGSVRHRLDQLREALAPSTGLKDLSTSEHDRS